MNYLRETYMRLFHKRTNITTMLDIIGCILLVTGVFLFSIPLGFIASGLACFFASFILTQNGEQDEPDQSYQ